MIGQAVQALIRSGGHFVVVKKKFAGVGRRRLRGSEGGIGALEGGEGGEEDWRARGGGSGD